MRDYGLMRLRCPMFLSGMLLERHGAIGSVAVSKTAG